VVTATIDRFEGERQEIAVLIEGTEDSKDSKRRGGGIKVDVDRSLLPEGSAKGSVIRLSCSLGEGDEETVRQALSGAELDQAATEERGERVRNRIERLKDRGDRG
jgi:hypothetical protein